ncbi:hypothetical protein C8F04DRAFT_1185890 [Mycena alexandri]|uniref:Uncharacterized protein n=1 Tax=Mycena alexandri TaxID=1745969 RepID=A0AAD6X1L9_9AGAR|nr:hypothetical protein C8F04DRAFT_1185890 [Mycena alexandri]
MLHTNSDNYGQNQLSKEQKKIPKDCVRRLEFGCRGPRLRTETKDDEEKIKLGRERRRERDADNKEVGRRQRFIKKYGFKAYWDHYKPLLNEFNHYCLPGVRVEVPKEEQKPNLTYGKYSSTTGLKQGLQASPKLPGAQNDGARGSCPSSAWLQSESKRRAQLPLSLDGVGHLALNDGVGLGVGLGLRLGDEADGDPWAWGAHYLNASDVARWRRSGPGFMFGTGTGSALHLFAVCTLGPRKAGPHPHWSTLRTVEGRREGDGDGMGVS